MENSEHNYYVYVWYAIENGGMVPFYVGSSKIEARYRDKINRSHDFVEFVSSHECVSTKVAEGLSLEVSVALERLVKAVMKDKGISIIDAEEDAVERKRMQRKGIDSMPVINGKKISSKTGRPTGRPQKPVEYVLEDGETVKEACERLGISRTQWYRAKKGAEHSPSDQRPAMPR